MHKMKTEYLPRCYALSWDPKKVSLLFKIEKTTMPRLVEIFTNETPLMEHMYKIHPVPHNFGNIGKTGLPFGFEDQFKFESEDAGTFTYRWTIPPAKKYTGKKCPRCKGTGKSDFDQKCFDCDNGKEKVHTEDTFISSGLKTFYCLTQIMSALLLDYVCGESKIETSERKQLVHLEIASTPGYGTAYVGGWVDDAIFDWIKDENSEEKPIIEAMEGVDERLWLRKPYHFSFQFIWNGENFGLQVPGNACDVGTYYGMMNMYHIGKALGCHNTDNSSQQLCFIAGFATLNDEVEIWLK